MDEDEDESRASIDSLMLSDFAVHEEVGDQDMQDVIDGDLVHEMTDQDIIESTSDDWTHGISLDDDEEEIVTPWSNEGDSLFLICHDSTPPMSGNEHLKVILARSGKDNIRVEDIKDGQLANIGFYLKVVLSSPNWVCVIMGMQPTYAEAIANKVPNDNDKKEDEGSATKSFITIVSWVDVMKISPELFAHILPTSNNNNPQDDEDGDNATTRTPTRGLRNFRRATQEENDPMKGLMWENEQESDDSSVENKHVIFSLIPPFNTMGDAMAVIQDLIVMAKNGQRRRRRMTADEHEEQDGAQKNNNRQHGRKLRQLSIQDAFSITQSGGDHSTSSYHNWSRIISRGLESEQEQHSCVSILENIVLESSFRSSFEFPLVTSLTDVGSKTKTTTSSSSPDPECIASIVAGLSVHPNVVNVGILSKTVQLDNAKAQWVVQGDFETKNTGVRKRPFFDAGLDGSGQVVSVSDTGLDVDNCYFKDQRGDGSSFSGWDYSRRKVVRYEISKRGGDNTDTQRGHGKFYSDLYK